MRENQGRAFNPAQRFFSLLSLLAPWITKRGVVEVKQRTRYFTHILMCFRINRRRLTTIRCQRPAVQYYTFLLWQRRIFCSIAPMSLMRSIPFCNLTIRRGSKMPSTLSLPACPTGTSRLVEACRLCFVCCPGRVGTRTGCIGWRTSPATAL